MSLLASFDDAIVVGVGDDDDDLTSNNNSMKTNDELDWTDSQRITLTIVPRCGAFLSLVCSAWIVRRVIRMHRFHRIHHLPKVGMFHRIIMGCAVTTIILNANILYGQLAVPIDFQDDGYPMARGSTATCSTQGFLYVMGFVVPSYYVALSIVCTCAIRHKFQLQWYEWIEKYIHVGVYIFPILSGSIFASLEAYNPNYIDCYAVGLPRGCGDNNPNGILCERGPNNMYLLNRWLVGLPLGILLLLPTILMLVTYLRMRYMEGAKGRGVASSMGRQASIYLLALYWTYSLRFVYLIVYLKVGKYIFPLHVLSTTVEFMQGVWIAIAYVYLCGDTEYDLNNHNHNNNHNNIAGENDNHEGTVFGGTNNNNNNNNDGSPTVKSPGSGDLSLDDNDNNNSNTTNNTKKKRRNSYKSSGGGTDSGSVMSSGMTKAFRIFDGMGSPDPDSPWAAYLMEDDFEDDDYQHDCGEYDDSQFIMTSSTSLSKLSNNNNKNNPNNISSKASTIEEETSKHEDISGHEEEDDGDNPASAEDGPNNNYNTNSVLASDVWLSQSSDLSE